MSDREQEATEQVPRLPNNLAGRVRKTWDDYDLDDIKELGKHSY